MSEQVWTAAAEPTLGTVSPPTVCGPQAVIPCVLGALGMFSLSFATATDARGLGFCKKKVL